MKVVNFMAYELCFSHSIFRLLSLVQGDFLFLALLYHVPFDMGYVSLFFSWSERLKLLK